MPSRISTALQPLFSWVQRRVDQGEKILQSRWFLAVYLIFYFVVVSAVALNRWWQFENYYFDHGIFDQSLWSVAHGQAPMFDHIRIDRLNQLSDHFTPVMYLLAPLYWFTSAYEPLILLQGVFVVAAAGVMWHLSRVLKLSGWISAALLISFTWFLGLQNALIAGFHTELPALLTLALAFLFLEKKWWKLYWICLFLTLGLKETFVSIGVGIGMYLLLTKKWVPGLATVVVSVAYFYLVTKWVIPAIGGLPYYYTNDAIDWKTVPLRLVWPELKLKTLIISFSSFGGLSFLNPTTWPLLGQDFFVRFIMARGNFAWDFGFHYSVMSALLLYFSSVKSAQWLQRLRWYKKWSWVHAGVIVLLVAFFHFKNHGPLGMAFNPVFFSQTADSQFLVDFVAKIPAQGRVMAPNNLAVKMTHTHDVMLLRNNYWFWMPDVIAIDARPGQNPNNFWPPENINVLFERLQVDPNYQEFAVSQEQRYYVKRDQVDSEFYLLQNWH